MSSIRLHSPHPSFALTTVVLHTPHQFDFHLSLSSSDNLAEQLTKTLGFPAAGCRAAKTLEDHVKKLDEEYDKLNDHMAKGATSSFDATSGSQLCR